MSYTLSDSFKYAAKSQSCQPDWAMKLYYYSVSAENSNSFIGISSKDRLIDGVKYYGIVTNWSSVVKTMDIANSKAQLAGFTIECVNKWKTDTFSALLYGDSNDYFVNNKSLLYMGNNSETTLSNWILIGEYRLVNVGHDAQTVTLEFEERLPWDKLSLPREKTGRGIYFPLIYGEYTAETSEPHGEGGSTDFCDSAVVWPLPVERTYLEDIVCLARDGIGTGVAVKCHHWEPSLEVFVPLDTTNNTAAYTSTPDNDGRSVNAPGDLRRGMKFYPLGEGDSNEWTNPTLCLNQNDLNYTYEDLGVVNGTTEYSYLALQLPSIDGTLQAIQVYVKYDLEFTDQGGATFAIDLFDVTYNTSSTPSDTDGTSVAIVAKTDADEDESFGSWTDFNYSLYTANLYQANNTIPSELKLCFKVAASAPGVDAAVRISSIYISVTVAQALDNSLWKYDKTAAWYGSQLKYLYSGTDGPTDSAWGGSSTLTECQQFHRDILQSYVGLATADINTTTWNALDTAKNGWTARLWELEPVPVKELLERLQFEGGFVAFWSQQDVKYVWVKNDPSGDSVETLTEDDYRDLAISLTPWDEVVTKRVYNYGRHPERDSYESSATWPSSGGLRTEYNVGSSEDIEEIDLRYLVDDITGGTNPNDHIGRYYDNILNEPKIIVNCRIMNPLYFNLEIGDIVQFNDSKIDPFDKSWTNLYFMIIEERRQPQQLEIICREVYES